MKLNHLEAVEQSSQDKCNGQIDSVGSYFLIWCFDALGDRSWRVIGLHPESPHDLFGRFCIYVSQPLEFVHCWNF